MRYLGWRCWPVWRWWGSLLRLALKPLGRSLPTCCECDGPRIGSNYFTMLLYCSALTLQYFFLILYEYVYLRYDLIFTILLLLAIFVQWNFQPLIRHTSLFLILLLLYHICSPVAVILLHKFSPVVFCSREAIGIREKKSALYSYAVY